MNAKKATNDKNIPPKVWKLKVATWGLQRIKKDSDTDAFVQVLRTFKEPLFYRTIPVAVSES